MPSGSKPLLGPTITEFYDVELYDGELIIRNPGKINGSEMRYCIMMHILRYCIDIPARIPSKVMTLLV